jgi:transcription antitermination factor NusA-like protein
LLHEEVPNLGPDGALEVVAIARRPGVLSKVAIRARGQRSATAAIGADHLARISRRLDGERIEVVHWQRSANAYIADALGLGEVPPILLIPRIRHARVLLGEIDVRGIAGWRGLNTILASALTGWRIRLEPVAATAAWHRLKIALQAKRPVHASVIGPAARGLRLELFGLYAVLSHPSRHHLVGDELEVRITRMDPDEGHIFVSDRLTRGPQLPLI